MEDLNLRFTQGEAIPTVGTEIHMRGMAGIYRVHIHRIKKAIYSTIDGSTVLEVKATRELLNEKEEAEHGA